MRQKQKQKKQFDYFQLAGEYSLSGTNSIFSHSQNN